MVIAYPHDIIQRTSHRDRNMFANHVKAQSASVCVLEPNGCNRLAFKLKTVVYLVRNAPQR
jgi:hypothetical protein